MKCLEAGTFRRVTATSDEDHIEFDAGELAMLLAGADAPMLRRRKRSSRYSVGPTWHHPRAASATRTTGRDTRLRPGCSRSDAER